MYEGLINFPELDLKNIHGQPYDNGQWDNSLQALIQEENNLVAWVPCVRYNTVSRCLREAKTDQPILLPKRTTTRWSCQVEATKAVLRGYKDFINALEEIIEDEEDTAKSRATATKSNTGNLKFLPESASVNEEAERLVREEDVFTNIVLSHSGYSIDKEIAANASTSISLIVGGHTHTFLFTGDKPPGPEPVRGPYPTIVRSKHGQKVLITQVSCASRYLGNITMLLNKHGKVNHFSGNPIFLDSLFPQDEKINEMLVPWQKLIDAQGEKVIGSTLLSLNITRCHYQECSLGDFVTDSMVFAYESSSNGSTSGVDCAVTNPGGLRGDLNIGNITYNELSTAQPFRNTIDIAKIKGEDLKRMFEFSAQPKQFSKLNLLQVSGIKMSYNLSQPQGNRVVSLKIRCRNCTHQIYEDLQLGHYYTIALPSFLTKGGTGFNFLEDVLIATKTGPLDMEVFQDYLSKHSPISYLDSERITVYDSERQEL
nr:apyrase-like [Leptinotarsa decemlineata]